MEAVSASDLRRAVTRKMSTLASNETGGIAVRTEKTAPIIFFGIMHAGYQQFLTFRLRDCLICRTGRRVGWNAFGGLTK
jgi:hypothetical protein